MKKIAIIGAGMAGLTAANYLRDYASVTVFDKSRGVGGRLATRRAEPYYFDHGVQHFSAKSEEFKDFIKPLITAGVIAPWQGRFVEIVAGEVVLEREWNESYPHYVGVSAINAIGKYLAQGIELNKGVRVAKIQKDGDDWYLYDIYDNKLGFYDWVVVAAPAQQALDLLPDFISIKTKIATYKMQACFALMLGFKTNLNLNFIAALVREANIGWISVNSSKPGRVGGCSLLVNSTNAWANKFIDADKLWVKEQLCRELEQIIDLDTASAEHIDLQAWRYANIAKQKGASCCLDVAARIAVCGDWFVQGRVEAAFHSGLAAAKSIIELI